MSSRKRSAKDFYGSRKTEKTPGTDANAEINSLRTTVDELNNQLSLVREEVRLLTTQQKSVYQEFTARLSAVEEKLKKEALDRKTAKGQLRSKIPLTVLVSCCFAEVQLPGLFKLTNFDGFMLVR